jgi:hypothetical protein
VRDPEYDTRGRHLVRLAAAAVRSLPHPVAFSVLDLEPAQRRELGVLFRRFRDSILPDTLIDAAIVKALTDGPDQALSNPYAL